MFYFLIPLLLGFSFNLASAFTTAFSRKWGERNGSIVTIILRDVLGIPVWAIGFGLAFVTPSLTLFTSTLYTDIVGWFLITVGGVIILIALVTIRWRAAGPSSRDTLAEDGLYAYVRHPIHSGTFLEFMGLLLLKPTSAVALACVLGVIWVLIQTRLEELDLLQRLPAYRGYLQRIPRFVPRRFWRKNSHHEQPR
jgi:protein-S-isoprenylcysteine O-methyltransferase Ste14